MEQQQHMKYVLPHEQFYKPGSLWKTRKIVVTTTEEDKPSYLIPETIALVLDTKKLGPTTFIKLLANQKIHYVSDALTDIGHSVYLLSLEEKRAD